MLIREARSRLLATLAGAGVTPGGVTAADVARVVEVYRCFAAIRADDVAPVEDDGDAVLAQFGTYGFRGEPEFSADLTRQLVAEGEGTLMWQLSCTFYWNPEPATNELGSGDLWSFGMTLDDFFAQVPALPGWAWALTSSRAPRELAITLEQV